MKNIYVIILGLMFLLLALVFFYPIIENNYYNRKTDFRLPQKYLVLFNDSIANVIKNEGFNISLVNDNDAYTLYSIRFDTSIVIWDIKGSNSIIANEVHIDTILDNTSIDFDDCEIMDKKSNRPIKVKHGYSMGKNLKISLGRKSNNVDYFYGNNYKGFYGDIDRLTFQDVDSKPFMIYETPQKWKNLFVLFLNNEAGFFIITIESKNRFNNDVLKLFNLNYKLK